MRGAASYLWLPLLLAGCAGRGDGIAVGDHWIPGPAIDRAVTEMKGSFPQWGRDSLAWAILDGGWGPAWILHDELAAASEAARREAEILAARLRAGEDFADLAAEHDLGRPLGGAGSGVGPFAPTPFELGSGRVAAAVAALEPGEWAGPLRTIQGWELVQLLDRAAVPRNRAAVQVRRIVIPVGGEEDRRRAVEAWNTLPLAGSAERLERLPFRFRDGRLARDS
ncbi:MAG: hypothetical protein D6702_04615 [Planctomycetota bacterium]|nr:MAG: hypothetical protein D6702_04615 [Planctomycetota bacterium]